MAAELDLKGFSGAEITRAGYIYGILESALKGDDEALNHFGAKLAEKYGLSWKTNAQYTAALIKV